jgi:quinol monooxygenase YgiN
MPLHHVVLFKLAGDDAGAAVDPLIATLVATAPGVLGHETQSDLGLRPGNPRSYQRLIHLTFADAAAFRTYLDCPEHQAFLAAIPDLVQTIAAIQYDGD